MTTTPLPSNWRDYITDEERQITNHWMRGIDSCVSKVGRRWDSHIPGAPLFTTKRAAYDYVSAFVCDAIPLRCLARIDGSEG